MKLAQHVLGVHRDASEAAAAMSHGRGEHDPAAHADGGDDGTDDNGFNLKRYIQFCRARVNAASPDPCVFGKGQKGGVRAFTVESLQGCWKLFVVPAWALLVLVSGWPMEGLNRQIFSGSASTGRNRQHNGFPELECR